MSITAQERTLYTDVWQALGESYASFSPGEHYLPIFLDMAGIPSEYESHGRGGAYLGSILDAGTGSGKGALALAGRGFAVTMCDITAEGLVAEAKDSLLIPFFEACLWDDLRVNRSQVGAQYGNLLGQVRHYDYVYCCDVMEHLPKQFTMLVIHRLLQAARKGVFLSIALQPDDFGVRIGTPLHQTVESFTWWRDTLGTLATVTEARDLLHTGCFYLESAC